jgi:hypothetical protein
MSKEKKEFNMGLELLKLIVTSLAWYYILAPLIIGIVIVVYFGIGLLIYQP